MRTSGGRSRKLTGDDMLYGLIRGVADVDEGI